MAGHRDSALYESQTLEPAGQSAGPSARGTGGRLSAHDLRRPPRGGGAGAARVRAQVEAALPGGIPELRRSRRPAFYLYRLSGLAMEGAAHYQRVGANQRRVPAPDQNPGVVAQRRGGSTFAVRPAAQWPNHPAPRRWLASFNRTGSTTESGLIVTCEVTNCSIPDPDAYCFSTT